MKKTHSLLIPFVLMASACSGGPSSELSETETPRPPVEMIANERGSTRVIINGCPKGYQEKLTGNPLYGDQRGLRLTCEPKKNSTNSLTP